jgi:hypothetical protein
MGASSGRTGSCPKTDCKTPHQRTQLRNLQGVESSGNGAKCGQIAMVRIIEFVKSAMNTGTTENQTSGEMEKRLSIPKHCSPAMWSTFMEVA